MKKLILILTLAGTAFIFSGCQKSDQANNPPMDKQATDEMAAEMEEQGGEMQDATAGEEKAK